MNRHEAIFDSLSGSTLLQISEYLKWNPLVSTSPATVLGQLPQEQRVRWLEQHRTELEEHISWVGTPIFSYALGNTKAYGNIVSDLAEQLGAKVSAGATTSDKEAQIVQKVWKDTLDRLSPSEREKLLAKVQALADEFGPSAKKEMTGFAALTAAQMSGFGVYLLGSTLLGALNSALGLGLGFGAFTGLSSLISVVIGPVGWAALGLFTIKRMGAPNYKKLLPVVILIAAERAGSAVIPPSSTMLRAASSPTSDVIPQPSIRSLITSEINEFTVVERKRRLRELPPHKYSRQEKNIFDLKPENRGLCEVVKTVCPESHFLELSPECQQVIRDLLTERLADQEKTERLNAANDKDAAKERRKQLRHEQQQAKLAKKQAFKVEFRNRRLHRSLSTMLRNVEFDDVALDRLSRMDDSQAEPVLRRLGLINLGEVIYRDSILGSNPKTYEAKAGHDYRIYFVPNGSKTRIRLIGDKGTQESDLAFLRAQG